jgi:stearoyl-CoA desaturase (delta-9 desaturase)
MPTDVLEQPADLLTRDDAPMAPEAPPSPPKLYRLVLTAIVAVGPIVAAAVVLGESIGKPVPWFPIVLMVLFLGVIGHGVTVGYHRLFTHKSFEARRPLKILLAVLGSMSFQGSVIGWVADHRRHHRYTDRPGDPHSPLWLGAEPVQGVRGFWHAHLGWAFCGDSTSRHDYASDLLADPDLVLIDRMWIPCCVVTLALPFIIGYLWTGTLAGALAALVFAGIIRIGISHNFTWSINSVCHRFGTRPFDTRDASTNFGALALFTMGESWHNNHHAFPRSARHGLDPGQVDSSAMLIRLFERCGWATNVQWPTPAQLDSRRAAS